MALSLIKPKRTYEEMLLDHLSNLTEEHKQTIVDSMIISAMGREDRSLIVTMGDTSVSRMLGMIELGKAYILQNIQLYDD